MRNAKLKVEIRMLKDALGCEDGFTSRRYKQGEVYKVEDHLARNFVISEVAEEAHDHHQEIMEKEKPQHDNKALSEKDIDNKSIKPNRRERRIS